MNVVVSGATGFIGSHLLPALLREGHVVKALIEPGVDTVRWKGVDSFAADIISGDGVSVAFQGADAVVHLAARNHVLKEASRDPLAAYQRVNVDGTRNVVRAASLAGARLFVHLSSVKAMGEGSDRILNEESPCVPKTPYGISKLESEEVVRAEAGGEGMSVVILRLPMVYGPVNKGNLTRMIRWAEKGFPFPRYHPENLRSMAYVGNVVAGIMAVLNASPQGIATYILKDKEDYSTRRMHGAICSALGKEPRYFPVPSLGVRVGGWLSEDFRKITGSFLVSGAKFEEEMRFTPPFSLEEGIERTVEWYRHSAR